MLADISQAHRPTGIIYVRTAWPLALYHAVISANGLYAYFFVLFLRVMAYTFLPIWLISLGRPHACRSRETTVPGNSGLDFFTFGNDTPGDQVRNATHLILVCFLTCEFLSSLCWIFQSWRLFF